MLGTVVVAVVEVVEVVVVAADGGVVVVVEPADVVKATTVLAVATINRPLPIPGVGKWLAG